MWKSTTTRCCYSLEFHLLHVELLTQQKGICSVLHNKDFTKPDRAKELEIKNEHWIVMEKLCEVLKPFEIATSQLSGEL